MSESGRSAGRVMMVGDAAIASHCLRRLVESGFEVVGCLPGSDAFAAECRIMGVRTFEVESSLDVLLDVPCDWILSVFNIRILPRRVIEHPSRGVVNFHDGPLPRYAGLYAPTRALIDGEKEHGVVWHLVDEGIDTGDLLVTEAVPIEEEDTALSLQLRCLEAGSRSFDRLIPMLRESSPSGRVQDRSLRTCFGHAQWSRRGIETDWRSSASEIRRLVAAHDFGPYDNPVGHPRCRLDGRWHALLDVDRCEDPQEDGVVVPPGTIWVTDEGALQVQCGEGRLVVRGIHPPIETTPGFRSCMVVRDDAELDAIEAWDERRFREEFFWRNRISRIGSNFSWHEDGDLVSMDLGDCFDDLVGGLIACHALHDDHAIEFALKWVEDDLHRDVGPGVDPALTELLHPLAPIRVPIDSEMKLGRLAERVGDTIAHARERGPFLRDIPDRVGAGGRPLVDPERMPVRVVDSTSDHLASPATWTFQKSDSGTWSVRGPRWAMQSFADLFEHRRRLLQENPDASVASLPRVVGRTEADIETWEGSQSIPVPKSTLLIMADRLRRADPGKTFVDDPKGGGATDLEMAELVQAWSERLRVAGVVRGDVVPVALDRGTPLVAVMLATLFLGASFAPLDPLAPEERLRRVLEILEARVGVASSGFGLPQVGTQWLTSPSENVEMKGFFDGIERPAPDQVAFVLFTSGSTGKPRGVRITHRNIDQYLEVVAENIEPAAYDASAWTSSVAFDSSVAEVLYPSVMDGTIVVLDRSDLSSAASLSRVFRERRITGFGCATALWSTWVKHVSRTGDSIPPTLRHVDIGGSVAEPDVIRQWLDMAEPSVRLVNRYGPTETSVTVTMHEVDASSLTRQSIPIGRPERGTEIRILDDRCRRVPPGVEGEIWIGGGQVALGYLGTDRDQGGFQPLAGAEGRWFRTGDRAAWNSQGEILFGGRSDDQVKVGGYRVELGEIQQSISKIDDRFDFEVLSIGEGSERTLGVVVEAAVVDIEIDSWITGIEAGLERLLPAYAIPRRWRFVESIPRTPSGKTDRKSACRLLEDVDDGDASPGDPSSPDWVADQVGRVLGRRINDFSKSFFELGGDSLGAMRLHSILEEACGHSLPLTLVHAARGIEDLVDRVVRSASRTSVETIKHGHRRHLVAETPQATEILFMPGLHGEATLRHAWASLGDQCSIGAIDLDIDRCRFMLDRDRGPGRFAAFTTELVDLVIERADRKTPILMGYSIGGWIAFEIATVCRERGLELPPPILIEPGIHIGGGFIHRCRSMKDTVIDSILNLDPVRSLQQRLIRNQRSASDPDPRDPRGRLPDEKDLEFQRLLIDALGDHRPRAADVSIRLVLRRGRGRRFATWHRLALGGVETDWVDLKEHEDFFRYGSESILAGVVDRHRFGMRTDLEQTTR